MQEKSSGMVSASWGPTARRNYHPWIWKLSRPGTVGRVRRRWPRSSALSCSLLGTQMGLFRCWSFCCGACSAR
eukprot:scaffold2234_cov66-Phaeocystis_antarctica.AAC.7